MWETYFFNILKQYIKFQAVLKRPVQFLVNRTWNCSCYKLYMNKYSDVFHVTGISILNVCKSLKLSKVT